MAKLLYLHYLCGFAFCSEFIFKEEKVYRTYMSLLHHTALTVESISFVNLLGNLTDEQLTHELQEVCQSTKAHHCGEIISIFKGKYYDWRKLETTRAALPVLSFTYEDYHIAIKEDGARTSFLPQTSDVQKHDATDILNIVSGFWPVDNKYSHHRDKDMHGGARVPTDSPYSTWFPTTLAINMPYIFFTNEANFRMFSALRNPIPTRLVSHSISDFMVRGTYKHTWTHPEHVPYPELGMIWNEKINLLYVASMMRPHVEYFAWVDAGISLFRNTTPPAEQWSADLGKSG
jgi:hypothetical protein